MIVMPDENKMDSVFIARTFSSFLYISLVGSPVFWCLLVIMLWVGCDCCIFWSCAIVLFFIFLHCIFTSITTSMQTYFCIILSPTSTLKQNLHIYTTTYLYNKCKKEKLWHLPIFIKNLKPNVLMEPFLNSPFIISRYCMKRFFLLNYLFVKCTMSFTGTSC